GVLLVIRGRVDLEHLDEEARRAAGRERAFGVAAGLASSLCNASSGVMAKFALAQVGALPASTIRITGSAALLAGSVVVTGGRAAAFLPLRTITARGKEIAAIFFGTFIGIFLQQGALERTDASVALCLLSTTPIFLLPLALVVLRERYRGIAV